MAGKFCKDTKSETFWPPEMTRQARGRLNKKKHKWGKKGRGRQEAEKKPTWIVCTIEMQLPYNFTWTIKPWPPARPKFFAYHIRIILYPVPSFCSLWTADVFRVVASLPPKISEVREATTGITSAIRRLIFLQTWKSRIDIAKFSDAKDTGREFIKTKQA